MGTAAGLQAGEEAQQAARRAASAAAAATRSQAEADKAKEAQIRHRGDAETTAALAERANRWNHIALSNPRRACKLP